MGKTTQARRKTHTLCDRLDAHTIFIHDRINLSVFIGKREHGICVARAIFDDGGGSFEGMFVTSVRRHVFIRPASVSTAERHFARATHMHARSDMCAWTTRARTTALSQTHTHESTHTRRHYIADARNVMRARAQHTHTKITYTQFELAVVVVVVASTASESRNRGVYTALCPLLRWACLLNGAWSIRIIWSIQQFYEM